MKQRVPVVKYLFITKYINNIQGAAVKPDNYSGTSECDLSGRELRLHLALPDNWNLVNMECEHSVFVVHHITKITIVL